jgi:hypothetical protein
MLLQVVVRPVPRLVGFRRAVARINDQAGTAAVLYDGSYESPFILYRRLADPELRTVTYRTSRMVGGGRIFRDQSYTPFVADPSELREVFLRAGARWVVAEYPREPFSEQEQWFRTFLQGSDFEPLERFEVSLPGQERLELQLYRYRHALTPDDELTIPLLTLQRGEFEFRPGQALVPWQP